MGFQAIIWRDPIDTHMYHIGLEANIPFTIMSAHQSGLFDLLDDTGRSAIRNLRPGDRHKLELQLIVGEKVKQ